MSSVNISGDRGVENCYITSMDHRIKYKGTPIENSPDSLPSNHRRVQEPLVLWPHRSWTLTVDLLLIMQILNGWVWVLAIFDRNVHRAMFNRYNNDIDGIKKETYP